MGEIRSDTGVGMSRAEKLLVFLALIAAVSCIAGIAANTPAAMHHETMNQRAITAGNLKHAPGYGDYAEFIRRNP